MCKLHAGKNKNSDLIHQHCTSDTYWYTKWPLNLYLRGVVIEIGQSSLVLKIGRVRVVAFTNDIFEVFVDHTGVGTDFKLTETGESQQFVLVVNVALFRGR